jgi:hypothetical protein
MKAPSISFPQPIPFSKEEIDRLDDKLFGVYLLLPGDNLENPQYTIIDAGPIKSRLMKLLSDKALASHFTYVIANQSNTSTIKEELLKNFTKWPPNTSLSR